MIIPVFIVIPDNNLAKFMTVFLSGSNILTNLGTKAEVGNALLLAVDATEAGYLLRGTQLHVNMYYLNIDII